LTTSGYKINLERGEEKMSFAQAVKKYREDHGLNQTEFAERVGVARSSVSEWETGRKIPQHRAVRRKVRRMLAGAGSKVLIKR